MNANVNVIATVEVIGLSLTTGSRSRMKPGFAGDSWSEESRDDSWPDEGSDDSSPTKSASAEALRAAMP